MKQFISLIKTEFRRIFSNSVLVAIFFGAPVLYGLMFIQVYKKGKVAEMAIVVIDEDNTPMSAKIIDALNDNENLTVAKVQFDAGNIAAEMPSKEYVSVISIPKEFEADILQKRYPELMVDVNTANLVTANFASRAIQTVLGTFSAGVEIESLKKAGMDHATALQRYEPFKVNYNRFYNPSGNYLYLMLPGILGTIMQQVIFLGLGLVFARDFEDGYFNKLVKTSRSSLYHILLKLTPFLLLTAAMWMVVGSFYFIYRIDIPVFSIQMAALVTLFSLACMFIGMLFSLAIPNQLKATELLMVLATPSFILSGYTWPLEGMPVLIQRFADILPLTHFLQGFRKLSVYGGTFRDIQPQMMALGIITIVSFVLIALLLQLKIRNTKNQVVTQ
ncbi:ABC transporter permease [Terrimonas rubra]|uniref:ABC transporter permease n=1 Tax=Terrimonas rubra TaxID=1035890 RepID=A0ABW6ACS0_9BACT